MNDDAIAEAIILAGKLVVKFEGYRSRPYFCPAGVPTIGYGSTRYPNGRPVTIVDGPLIEEVARAMMLRHLREVCLPAVLRLCPEVDEPERLAALLDFVYNLGEGNLERSTLRRLINAGKWEKVPDEIKKWCRRGNQKLPGLVARRQAEAELIGATLL